MSHSEYLRCLAAALAEVGYPDAPITVTNGLVTVGCIPHGMDESLNPAMPPEAVLDRAYELCRPQSKGGPIADG